jgi:hypothetical protein
MTTIAFLAGWLASPGTHRAMEKRSAGIAADFEIKTLAPLHSGYSHGTEPAFTSGTFSVAHPISGSISQQSISY